VTASNYGRLFALSFMNLTDATSAFEQIHVTSFMQTTRVSISIPQLDRRHVISLDRSNQWTYSTDIMRDIGVPRNVSSDAIRCDTTRDAILTRARKPT